MKKSLFTSLLLSALTVRVSAQQIQSLQISPANPTTNDSITLIADVQFSSGTCDQKDLIMSQSGSDFYASAIHCVGPLTYICNNIDSFSTGPLPAGNYRFIYHVDAGYGPAPCTPGIVSGPTDTLAFTVSTITTMNDKLPDALNCYYANQKIIFNNLQEKTELRIYNGEGKIIYTANDLSNNFINFNKQGIYIIMLLNKSGSVQKRIIVP